jgi:uncharacterized protein with HEPN domain
MSRSAGLIFRRLLIGIAFVPTDKPTRRLKDIIANADRIAKHLKDLDRTAFAKNEMAIDAVERCLLRISEAAIKLGDRAEAWMPNQDWTGIRGLGNWLRHKYDAVKLDDIWHSSIMELPGLRDDCAEVLARLEAEKNDKD